MAKQKRNSKVPRFSRATNQNRSTVSRFGESTPAPEAAAPATRYGKIAEGAKKFGSTVNDYFATPGTQVMLGRLGAALSEPGSTWERVGLTSADIATRRDAQDYLQQTQTGQPPDRLGAYGRKNVGSTLSPEYQAQVQSAQATRKLAEEQLDLQRQGQRDTRTANRSLADYRTESLGLGRDQLDMSREESERTANYRDAQMKILESNLTLDQQKQKLDALDRTIGQGMDFAKIGIDAYRAIKQGQITDAQIFALKNPGAGSGTGSKIGQSVAEDTVGRHLLAKYLPEGTYNKLSVNLLGETQPVSLNAVINKLPRGVQEQVNLIAGFLGQSNDPIAIQRAIDAIDAMAQVLGQGQQGQQGPTPEPVAKGPGMGQRILEGGMNLARRKMEFDRTRADVTVAAGTGIAGAIGGAVDFAQSGVAAAGKTARNVGRAAMDIEGDTTSGQQYGTTKTFRELNQDPSIMKNAQGEFVDTDFTETELKTRFALKPDIRINKNTQQIAHLYKMGGLEYWFLQPKE